MKEFFEEDEESPDMELKICHLYPDVLNLYGDRGNIQCLQRRLAWRGIDCQVDFMGIGDYKSLSGYDLFFIGGGQDFDQEILLEDLRLRKGVEIRAALEDEKLSAVVASLITYEASDPNIDEFFIDYDNAFTTKALYRMRIKWPIFQSVVRPDPGNA